MAISFGRIRDDVCRPWNHPHVLLAGGGPDPDLRRAVLQDKVERIIRLVGYGTWFVGVTYLFGSITYLQLRYDVGHRCGVSGYDGMNEICRVFPISIIAGIGTVFFSIFPCCSCSAPLANGITWLHRKIWGDS